MMEAAGDGGQRKTTRTAVAISAAISEAAAAVNWPVSGKRVKGSDRAGWSSDYYSTWHPTGLGLLTR